MDDVGSMYGFRIELVEDVVNRIVDVFSPERIIIFGSVARGTYTDESDVDLLIVMDSDMDPHETAVAVRRAVRDIHVGKDIIVLTPEQFKEQSEDPWDFTHEIVRTGKVVYEALTE